MAKSSGLGDQLFVAGVDLSGDVGTVQRIAAPSGQLDVTAINALGHERIYGQFDGAIEFTSFFNDAAGQQHATLKAKGSGADQIVSYFKGSTQGNMAASLVAKQINYDPNRGADGSMLLASQFLANAKSLDYGLQLTDGKRTDTSATSPAGGLDAGAATANGLIAYLHVFSFTGTSCTVTVQMDTVSNFATPTTALTFTAATGVTAERKASASLTTAVEQYLRVITTGTFSECTFAVMASRYAVVL